ncbi:hypothetical protein [Catellatospora citrea]|uniref:Uncharacterized protein n=1 Tax=Catellatospora citrea TaxID=53366 RepID=A0A8J3P3K0_9ACTN|nr:hypothetical protein [Catellatospora citrea]RKE08808.1 hypothetical protein C8E86_3675 [Catellatospora citrea]GIG02432.1 hypothetical protein Cci01nite_75250 [Catellatospora citrea]
MTPQAGDILHVTREASVQFLRPMMFRVIRVHDWPTYEGWVWLDGYQLNAAGDAVERRSIFVQRAGLRIVPDNSASARARTAPGRVGQRPALGRTPHLRPATAGAR